MDALEPAHQAILRCYLAHFSESELDELIIKLTNEAYEINIGRCYILDNSGCTLTLDTDFYQAFWAIFHISSPSLICSTSSSHKMSCRGLHTNN